MTTTIKDIDSRVRSDAKDCISFGRRTVYDRHPYFVATLYNLRLVEDPSVETMAVDDGNRLFYDPRFASKHGRHYAATFLVHEVGHIIRDHAARFKEARVWLEPLYRKARAALLAAYGITDLHMLWNWAGDIEINDDLARCGFKFPKDFQPVTAQALKFPEKNTAEFYARKLCEQAEADSEPRAGKPKVSVLPGAGGKCGGCAGNPHDWERKDKPAKADAATKEVLKKATANAIVAHAKVNGIGSVPGDWVTWANQVLQPPKIDWRRKLPSAIRHAIQDKAGAVDYRFNRPSRRSTKFYLPSLRKPVVKMGVAFDTSGSMGGARTEKAAAELLGIARAVGGKVEAFAVDAKVQATRVVKTEADLPLLLKGGGGTDMRLAIKEAARRKWNVLVVLTDAESPWPKPEEMPRGLRVVLCVIGDYKVPDGIATVIRVEE